MLLISPMGGEDIAEVAELDRETGSGWAILHFEQQLTAPCSFHLVVRHKIDRPLCGFICGQLVSPEAEIHKIVVAKPYRRKSLNTTLMRHTLQFFTDQKVTSCFLELRATNTAAKRLYRNFNFLPITLRKKILHRTFRGCYYYETRSLVADQQKQNNTNF